MSRDAALDAIDQLHFFESVRWLEEIDSTNRCLARELKSETPPALPALLVADRQIAGVGRGRNAWWSPTGCLMFSMAVPWSMTTPNRSLLPLWVGLAVAQSLAEWSVEQPKVKWPNDVYIDDRKVCGILIESSTLRHRDGREEEYSIIGVGINCCVEFESAPQELQASAISLHRAAPKSLSESIEPATVLVALMERFIETFHHASQGSKWLEQHWPDWSWLDGKWVAVSGGDVELVGVAHGIDPCGALKIEDRFGRMHTILSGTVRAIEKST